MKAHFYDNGSIGILGDEGDLKGTAPGYQELVAEAVSGIAGLPAGQRVVRAAAEARSIAKPAAERRAQKEGLLAERAALAAEMPAGFASRITEIDQQVAELDRLEGVAAEVEALRSNAVSALSARDCENEIVAPAVRRYRAAAAARLAEARKMAEKVLNAALSQPEVETALATYFAAKAAADSLDLESITAGGNLQHTAVREIAHRAVRQFLADQAVA